MPNHVHGVVWLDATEPPEAQHAAQLQRNSGAPSGSLGAFVRGHKSAVTREINLTRNTPGQRVWQPNYYEHIIRDENGLVRIREYIEDNPRRWHLDRENPNGLPDDQEIAFWRDLNPAVVAQRAAPADQQ
jgi:REP element-mobilizing transposase RayT